MCLGVKLLEESWASSGELVLKCVLGSKEKSERVKVGQLYLGLNRGHVSYTILPLIG